MREVTLLSLPFIYNTEHLLPGRECRWLVPGQGREALIRRAQLSGLVALVMQESNGQAFDQPGDSVTIAKVLQVNWLHHKGIELHLSLERCARVLQQTSSPSGSVLQLQEQPTWPNAEIDSAVLRFIRESYLALRYAHPERASAPPTTQHNDYAAWLCYRWLELLPLPVANKQALLKESHLEPGMRYIKNILQQGDRLVDPQRSKGIN